MRKFNLCFSILLALSVCCGCSILTAALSGPFVESGLPGFQINVDQCYRSGSNVFIDLSFNNLNSSDFYVRLSTTAASDNTGKEYSYQARTFRNAKQDVTEINDTFIAHATKKCTLVLMNVPEQATSIQYIDMPGIYQSRQAGIGNTDTRLRIRNIQIN